MEAGTRHTCGLYVHVPFCPSKCGYCDFYSIPAAGQDSAALVSGLVAELAEQVGGSPGPIATIFVGGGTPTVLPVAELSLLMDALVAVARHPTCQEFTVEANPATLDQEKVAVLADAGVTRLSLGAQSFHQSELSVLERAHKPADIAQAVAIARAAGIRRVNLDLIYGVPGQTMTTWGDSLDRAMDLRPDHLALYGLTYEPETQLTRRRDEGRVRPCDERLEAEMYTAAVRQVGRRGFEQYEISNFAQSGRRCLHNLAYWHGRPYIGVGPSAVGCIDGVRYRNVADVAEYVRMIDRAGEAVVETERVEGRRLVAETIMLQLRLADGVEPATFRRRTGVDLRRACVGTIRRHERLGTLEAGLSRIALTERGRLFADTVIADFMAELDAVAGLPH